MAILKVLFMFLCTFMLLNAQSANSAIPEETQKMIELANNNGPYVGLVIPNLFEMNPLLQSPSFTSTNFTIDFAGRRFRFGIIGEKKVILVLTGLAMINSGVTTQLLLSLFSIEGVVHYGTAGHVNPSFNFGDVTIPQYWSHTGLWNWQKYGDGPEDELALEENGDYTREIGYLKFANYTTNVTNCICHDNILNNVWYQPEEVFPIDGILEEREHAFWVPVDTLYFEISKNLEGMELERCINSTTCLSETPKVATVQRGTSSNIYIDNAAYKNFIHGKFNVTTIDMESAAVALICFQQRVPFIAFRALADFVDGGSAQSDEASTFTPLASNNCVIVVVEFIKQLSANLKLETSLFTKERCRG